MVLMDESFVALLKYESLKYIAVINIADNLYRSPIARMS